MKRKGINEMSYNGYTNFQTWKFMLYLEEYLYECLQEQKEQQEQKLNYQDVYKTVKHFVNDMYDSADKNTVGYTFLNDVINSFLREINIKEVTDHLANALETYE